MTKDTEKTTITSLNKKKNLKIYIVVSFNITL